MRALPIHIKGRRTEILIFVKPFFRIYHFAGTQHGPLCCQRKYTKVSATSRSSDGLT